MQLTAFLWDPSLRPEHRTWETLVAAISRFMCRHHFVFYLIWSRCTCLLLWQSEKRKKKSKLPKFTERQVLMAIAGRLTGTLLGVRSIPSLPLSVEGQVHRLIQEATDKENLGSMYIWWMAWFWFALLSHQLLPDLKHVVLMNLSCSRLCLQGW